MQQRQRAGAARVDRG
uniref:Uncharacterized protein n=1 Tax=Arundo donax TaxID=35708 RepID=A0A0A9EP34_ARUDO